MEDLRSSYIILPLNGDMSFQFLPNLISGFNASANDVANDKVFTNIEYLISPIPEIENVYVNTINPSVSESNPLAEPAFIENADVRNETIFQCPKCEISFKEYNEYTDHMKTHSKEISFQCTKCRKDFNKLSLYQKHSLIHQEEKLFNCEVCHIGFNIENNYKVHMALHGNASTCPICDLSFQRMASLKSHLAIHQVEEFHTCPECSSEFENLADLKKHMKTHAQPIGTRPKELICSYCKVKFDSAALLRQHISSHVKVKKLVLNGKKYKKNQNINVEYKHQCTVCSKTFPKLSLLERHIRIHSGERPFVCRICDKGFSQKGTLQIHLLKHSGLRPFCCTLCPAKFNQKGNLKVHVQKTHTAKSEGEKTFKCSECDCIFKKVASLNGHMTKIHSADSEEITITSVINQLKNLGEQLNGNSQKVSDAYSDPTTNTQAEVDKHSHFGDRLAENLEEEMSKIYSIKQKFVGTTKVYVCRFCDKESKKPSDLIRHIRIHTKEKPFKCFCGNSFSLKSTLITHIQTHKKRNGRQCASCSRTFFSTKAWNKHMRKHNSSTSEDISLKMCNSQTSKDGLLEHMPKKNTNNISILRKVNLKRHIQSHTGHNRFSCKTCLRSFNDVLAMKEHMKLHDLKHLSCEICDKKFARKSLLIRHTKTHSTVMPYECFYCKKKFKHILMLRKHIDTHTKCDGQEKALGTQSIVFTEANGLVEQNAERPAAILKVDSSGMILDHIYDNDRDKLAVNASSDISTLPIRLELGENQDFQTIFMNCSGIPSEEALGNYFFSQLKLQPNDTLVLNSTNNDLEPTSLLFNVQTVDNETLPVIDIMDSQVYDDDCTDKLIEPSLQSPQIKSSAIKTDQVLSMVDKNQENCLQNDMSDDFLANTVSLYPNTKISFENSEINPVPLDLIAPESDKYSEKSGNENGADSLSLFDINLRQDQHENNAALNIIHCLVCKKMFYNIELYNSHVCMKADSKKSSVNENVQIESNPGTTSNILKSSKIQEKPEKSTKRLFHCVYCGKEFTSRGIYMRHVATHQKNGDRLHKCKFCEKQFKKPSDLSRHLRTHTGEKPFACDKCDKKFSLKSTLEGHYRTHNPQATKDFVCEVCNSFFSSNSSRKLHMLIHTGDKPHKCTFCDQKFRTVAHKKKHEQKIHLSRSKKITQGKANRITNILATAADMAMKNLEGNRDNMLEQQEETGPTMIQLEYPDQANPTVKLTESIQIDPAVLQLLQNSNILLQDINTDVFHLSENTLENLERTQIITTVEVDDGRNLDCEICHKKYASKEVLRKHMKLHLKNKFVCEQCKKWFPTIEALVEHEKLHAGHRPFSCFLCTNTFAELHHLKSHLKRIHQVVETNSASILKMSL